jgi:hypothetical protein
LKYYISKKPIIEAIYLSDASRLYGHGRRVIAPFQAEIAVIGRICFQNLRPCRLIVNRTPGVFSHYCPIVILGIKNNDDQTAINLAIRYSVVRPVINQILMGNVCFTYGLRF